MLGIEEIGVYIPPGRNENGELLEKFGFNQAFLDSKIGVERTSRKAADQETSDLCVMAVAALDRKLPDGLAIDSIDCLVVVTQNPDGKGLPHVSAVVHGKLGLPAGCFAFDISLGCSGFVAGLAAIMGFMERTGGKRGLLVTCDPYSKILDEEDRNTILLFGDAATATLISENAVWQPGVFDCGTIGAQHEALKVNETGKLEMNGRAVFDFSATYVPQSVARVLEREGLTIEDLDLGILHPGSKYIVDTVAKRLKLTNVARGNGDYGNTVSSSIPLLLENVQQPVQTVLISGFGVGLGWATTILRRTK